MNQLITEHANFRLAALCFKHPHHRVPHVTMRQNILFTPCWLIKKFLDCWTLRMKSQPPFETPVIVDPVDKT